MKLYQKILTTGALIVTSGIFGLTGCDQPKPKTLEGTVKEEFGTAQRIVESSGAWFGNESIKFGDITYGLVLENDTGEYTISINNHFTKPIYVLAKAIEPGDKVRITYDGSTRIGKDGIGKTDSDTVELIEKAKQ